MPTSPLRLRRLRDAETRAARIAAWRRRDRQTIDENLALIVASWRLLTRTVPIWPHQQSRYQPWKEPPSD